MFIRYIRFGKYYNLYINVKIFNAKGEAMIQLHYGINDAGLEKSVMLSEKS